MAFNSIHTALEALVNTMLATGLCAEINLIMSPNYSVEEGRIKAAEYRVECLKPVVVGNTPMTVTFTPPLMREDGSELMLQEITGYEIRFDGSCVSGWTLTSEGRSREAAVDCVGGIE